MDINLCSFVQLPLSPTLHGNMRLPYEVRLFIASSGILSAVIEDGVMFKWPTHLSHASGYLIVQGRLGPYPLARSNYNFVCTSELLFSSVELG